MIKCPYCGAENPDDAKFCGNCGKVLEEREKFRDRIKGKVREKYSKAKEKYAGRIITFFLKLALFSGLSIVLLFWVQSAIFELLKKSAPAVFELISILPINILISIVGFALGFVFSVMKGFKLQIVFFLICTVVLVTAPFFWTIQKSPEVQVMWCMFTGSDLATCQTLAAEGVPQATKTGRYSVLDVKFGDEYTGYKLPPIFTKMEGNDITIAPYSFSFTAENPSERETIEGFRFLEGVIYDSENDIVLTYMNPYQGMCQSIPCKIGPKEKVIFNIRQNNCVHYKLPEDKIYLNRVTVMVTTSYDYWGEGKNEFVVKSSEYVKGIRKPVATSSAGPIDITVYFSPSYFAPSLGILESEIPEEEELIVAFKLSKSGTNVAYIKGINITHLDTDGSITGFTTCTAPWGTKYNLIPIDGNTEKIDFSEWKNGFPLYREQHHYCSYKFNTHASPYKIIPFIVRVSYEYTQTISEDIIPTKPKIPINCPGTCEISEVDCTDGIDNDCDGKVDCADSDCKTQTGPNGLTCCIDDSDCQKCEKCSSNECILRGSDEPNECQEGYSCDGVHPYCILICSSPNQCLEEAKCPTFCEYNSDCEDDKCCCILT